MASGKDVKAGGAYVELFTKNGALYAGLKSAQDRMKSLGSFTRSAGLGLSAIGAGIATPLIAAGLAFAEVGSAARDGAARVGLTTEAFTELGFVARQSGTDMDAMSTGFKQMEKHLHEAASGSQEANKTLYDLGLTVDTLRGMTPDQQFERIADSISKIKSPSEKTAMAMQLFGKSGVDLIPILNEGGKGIQVLRDRAKELGLSMSTEAAAAAGDLGDNWDALKDTAQGLYVAVGRELAPTFAGLIDWLTRAAVSTREWIGNNGPLINTLFRVGAVLAAAGGLLVVFGTGAALVATAIGGLITLGSALAAVFAAIVSPIGLIALGLGGLTVAFFTLTDTGQSTLETLSGDFSETMGGIIDALASGNLSAAAEVLWAGLQLEFARGWQFLNSGWLDAKNATIEVIDGLLTSLRIKLDEWFPGFEQGFSDTLGFINDAWTVSVNILLDVWDSAFAILKKSLNYLRSLFDSTFDLKGANKAIDQAFDAKVSARGEGQNELLAQRMTERQRRSDALNESGTKAVLTGEQADRKRERDAAAEEAKKTDEERLAAAKKRLDVAVSTAHTEREEKTHAIKQRAEKGAEDALEGSKQSQRKGADANDVRTAGGLSAIAQAARGGSLQLQLLNFQKKTADEALKANDWNRKNNQQLIELNVNLPLQPTPIG